MSNCNFCCNLGGEQAEIMCMLIMMGSDAAVYLATVCISVTTM